MLFDQVADGIGIIFGDPEFGGVEADDEVREVCGDLFVGATFGEAGPGPDEVENPKLEIRNKSA